MANKTFDAPQKDFDFSALYQSMSDLRQGFWNLNKQKEILKKQISAAHGHFFTKFMNEKRTRESLSE